MSELDTFDTAPPVTADDSGPDESDLVHASLGRASDDEGGVYPPLAPDEHYDFDDSGESGWIGPSEEEWSQTRAAIEALARHTLAPYEEPWDPGEALDPLGDGFQSELGNLLHERDRFLLGLVEQQLAPLMHAEHERALAQGNERLESLLESEARGLDREVVTALAREQVLTAMNAGEQVDDRAAEQAIRDAVAKLRGGRPSRGSSRRSSVPKPPPGGDENESAVVSRMFRSEQPTLGPGE